ncbi:MAG TPA: flagellar basal body P-ring formation chaperone FlgA [Acidobacteriota bacterium]|nr:flagellar basal body P-ring formation chaperone FlgA [Acidobacteriota bacterium]
MTLSTVTRLLCCALLPAACLFTAAVATAEPAANFDARLQRAIEGAVCAHTGFEADEIAVTLHARRFPPLCREATAIRATVPPHDDAVGPTTVRVRFAGPEGEIAELPVPVCVEVYGEVLVTRDRLRREEPIPPEALELRRMEITRLVPWVVTDPDSVVGMWAARTISAGQVVDRRWLEPVPLVRRGDRITMVYSTGAVHVSTTAVAMEDGHLNQTIRIKRPNGNRLLSAVVVDEKSVRPIAPY